MRAGLGARLAIALKGSGITEADLTSIYGDNASSVGTSLIGRCCASANAFASAARYEYGSQARGDTTAAVCVRISAATKS